MTDCDKTGCGCSAGVTFDGLSSDYKRRLWAVIAINASMFAVEMGAGVLAGSQALQADALDFLGDTLTYGLSLAVIGLSLRVRASAALVKGVTLALMGLWVLGSTMWHTFVLGVPRAEVMGLIGFLALAANLTSVLILLKYKDGDANVRSVWLCSRNDAIGNFAVMLAAFGVWGTETGWPDVLVAAVLAALFLQSATKILRQAIDEWRLTSGGRAEMISSPAEYEREKRTMTARKWLIVSALLALAATDSMVLAQGQQQTPQQQMPMMGPGMMGHQMMGPGMQGMMGQGGMGMMGPGMMGGQGMGMGGCPMMRSGMMGQGMGQGGMGMMGPGMMGGQGMGGMMGMMGPGGMMQPFADANLAYTKAMLKITDAQEAAWTAYVTALKAHSQAMLDLQQKMWTQTGQTMPSTVDRMDWHAQLMEAHLNALKALKPATEALYKVLTPEQQQTANLLLPGMCCTM